MHRRLRALDLRLARLAARLKGWAQEEEAARRRREAGPIIARLLRGALRRAGVDPDAAAALRRLEAPAAEPPRFIHPLRRRAERPRTLLEALAAMTEAYRRRQPPSPPDLRQASVVELLAYYGPAGPARAAPA